MPSGIEFVGTKIQIHCKVGPYTYGLRNALLSNTSYVS